MPCCAIATAGRQPQASSTPPEHRCSAVIPSAALRDSSASSALNDRPQSPNGVQPMKTTLTAAALMRAAAPLAAQAADRDTAGVRAALGHYLAAHATGDGAHNAIVFHPVAMLFFTDNGQFRSRTGVEYIAGFTGKPAADEAQRRRRIVFVDAEGDAGAGKVELDYPTVRFVDYLTLLPIHGAGKIVY